MPAPNDDLTNLDFTRPGVIPAVKPRRYQSSVPPRIGEVARLFAQDEAARACAVLESVLATEDFGSAAQLAWGMLFDLYFILDRRQAFEALAIGYASKFGQAPPKWEHAAGVAPAPGKTAVATVTLSGELGANAAQPLAKLQGMAGKLPGVRLDLARVADVDADGCGALLETIRVFRRLDKSCVLAGGERVAAMLASRTAPGERAHEAAWLLLLEIYQNLGRREDFEKTAAGYAAAFAVPPPAWMAPQATPAVAVDCCRFAGELCGAGREPFAALLDCARHQAQVNVDATNLRRMDPDCADTFARLLDELKAEGKTVRIGHASHLLVGLWRSLGMERAAQFEPRKL